MNNWLEQETDRLYHEIAQLFPLMQGEEFEQLKGDIAKNGLHEAIWLHENGEIIDGRNRHRACIEALTKPTFRTWNGDGSLVSFVVSMNLHRRHLTSSQRAAVAVEVLPVLEMEAKEKRERTQGRPEKLCQEIDTVPEEKIRATQQAAEIFNTNRQYVSDAKRLSEDDPVLFEQVKSGEKTIPQAKQEAANIHTRQIMGSSQSTEWYTPQHIIDLVLEMFDGIVDTDPCSNDKDDPNVPATFIYTTEDDGLSQSWHGAVYMNPPYGTTVGDWVNALVQKYKAGEINEAITLLPGRIDTQWFQPLYDYLICAIKGRLRFANANSPAPFPSVVVYLGENRQQFINTFKRLGPIMEKISSNE